MIINYKPSREQPQFQHKHGEDQGKVIQVSRTDGS